MGRQTWQVIRQSKAFYVNTYRICLTVLICSLFANGLLTVMIGFIYLNEPEHDFYATSGITAPVPLTALSAPNNSAVALLPPDPESDNAVKVIPN